MDAHEIHGNHTVPTGRFTRACRYLGRFLDICMHSRWFAAGVMAFAVSYGFHIVEEEGQERLDKQQRILACVVKETAYRQQLVGADERVTLTPILKNCKKQEDK